MANNRLYIVDTTTGDKFLLCKSVGYDWGIFCPWSCRRGKFFLWLTDTWLMQTIRRVRRIRELNVWIEDRDIKAAQCGGKNSTLLLKTEYEIDNG